MQHAGQDTQSLDVNEMSLREHLLAAQAAGQAQSLQTATHDHAGSGNSSSPHEPNIDPAIAGSAYAMSVGESGGEDTTPDGKKGAKRELSTSKRAAQNRAAQRAFRQRKEGYIKRLEEQVKDYQALEQNYKAVQAENYQLRDYVINLQSRLIENQQDFPQPPPAIELPNPRSGENLQQMSAPTAPMGQSAANQLQAAAAAAAQAEDLNVAKHQLSDAPYLQGYSGKRQKSEVQSGEPAGDQPQNGV